MSIPPKEDIPMEKHDDITQFIRIESGEGMAMINKQNVKLTDGSIINIYPGSYHQIINTSETEPLKLYTASLPEHSPPEHPPGLKQITKPNVIKTKTNKRNLLFLIDLF